MRIALCDDDEAQREKLKAAVDRHLVSRGYRPRYEEYSGGGPLVAEVAAGTDPFDLVFLDVYLEGDDGIAVARKLREQLNLLCEQSKDRYLDAGVETVFLMSNAAYSFLSSTIIKQVVSTGGRVEGLVTPLVEEALKKKLYEGKLSGGNTL